MRKLARVDRARKLLVGLALGLTTSLPMSVAARAAWPERPVTIVHGFPGSNADLLARILADGLGRRMSATFVVEPKAGAGGNIAAAHVARTAPDGYTLSIIIGGQAIAAALYNQLAYKPVDDFTFITTLTEFPMVMATYPDHQARDCKGLIEAARAAPQPLLVGSNGNGTAQHLSIELLAALGGFKLQHVPYRTSGNSVTDVLGKRIDFLTDTPTVTLPLIRDGQLRALCVTAKKRFFALPEVATLQETGIAGYESGSYLGLGAPAGLPAEIVERLVSETHKLLAEPATAAKLTELGSEIAPSTPEAFKARMQADIAKWTDVVRKAGIPKI